MKMQRNVYHTHISKMFTLLFYDPSLLLGGGGTDGVDGDEPMTAVLDCVSIFVSDIPR